MRSKLQWDNFLQRKNNTKYDQPLPPLKLQSTFRGTKLLGIRVRGENYLELELGDKQLGIRVGGTNHLELEFGENYLELELGGQPTWN